MSSKVFLQTLQSKLKGGNARSIHLNALPGRFTTRFDITQLYNINSKLSDSFLNVLLSQPSFEFKISFDNIDLNTWSDEDQKKLGLISKRLNSIIIENDDYYKEHGVKTLGFGYPILIKRSKKDPTKVIKAPLFIWALDAVKSSNKVNEWTILRNKTISTNGKFIDNDIHSVSINEVLLSFIKSEENITLASLSNESLEDAVVDKEELLSACAETLMALNGGDVESQLQLLRDNFGLKTLPDGPQIESIANTNAFIHFGGLLGLFRAQKESIITDISRLLEKFDTLKFDDLEVENGTMVPFSAVETDPSQQAIISLMGSEHAQIIQGPPGTGKSQSLTAIIINALANGKKSLVVCEKKTALDIIKKNLEKTSAQIGQMAAIIDDVNDDREAIVDAARERQYSSHDTHYWQNINSYSTIKKQVAAAANSINLQHQALNKPIYAGKKWNDYVGRYLQLIKNYKEIPLRYQLDRERFKFLDDDFELSELMGVLKNAESLFRYIENLPPEFDCIGNSFFLNNMFGEGRIAIEELHQSAQQQMPVLKNAIKQELLRGKEWARDILPKLPVIIQNDVNQYKSFFEGDTLAAGNVAQQFLGEQVIKNLSNTLNSQYEETLNLKRQYEKQVNNYYEVYHYALVTKINSYTEFVDQNVGEFGQRFFDNSKFSQAITNLFGVFSKRSQLLRKNRVVLLEKVKEIKNFLATRDYISHSFNDELNLNDLSQLSENIKTLQSSVSEWAKHYPQEIQSYLAFLNPEKCHTSAVLLKEKISEQLFKVNIILGDIENRYEFFQTEKLNDLNLFIEGFEDLQDRLKASLNLYASFREKFEKRKETIENLVERVEMLPLGKNGLTLINLSENTSEDLNGLLLKSNEFERVVTSIVNNKQELRSYYDWKKSYLSLDDHSRNVVDVVRNNIEENWSQAFECWYLFWILSLYEPPGLPKDDDEISNYKKLKGDFNQAQLNNIISVWKNRQAESIIQLKVSGQSINSLFNKKGAKGSRRNSLRTIVKNQFALFTDLFPVVLVNPSVCSSIIPLEEGIFDVVIFDEASQLRLEETYAALIRGKLKIVSGDKHQMAPSSYFEGGSVLLEPVDEENAEDEDQADYNASVLKESHRNLADSESLLGYAEDKGFKRSFLDVHYRSQHPHLIDFSNNAFYGQRLIPIPPKTDYRAIEFFQVDGIYEEQANRKEALKVIEILRDSISVHPDGSYPTVGVATFNLYQRNLILEEISKARRENTSFDVLMNNLGDSFFVKNLENIQGDERDIIIMSTTFGRKPDGSFLQTFGPIIQSKGHRMLNVIVTRAKHKVFVCSSVPQDYFSAYGQLIQKSGNKGRGIFYAYLAYARAVSEGDEMVRSQILALLSQYCFEKNGSIGETDFSSFLGSESPFEQEVFERLSLHVNVARLKQQYKIGGFRIDIVVTPKEANQPFIAIECDGASYHNSSEAYAWDIFRQEQLEKFGFVFYRIWSTRWWDSPERELENLVSFIRKYDIVN